MSSPLSNGAGCHFVIDSLPRSGSTAIARLLECHPDIRCLIEPFHPSRYEGRFNRFAKDPQTLENALEVIWKTYTGIKHVWESNSWPFVSRPDLNEQVITGPNRRVILVKRQNLLRRLVSNHISRQTNYWIGSRAGFEAALARTRLRPLDIGIAQTEIQCDKEAIDKRIATLEKYRITFRVLVYEKAFDEEKTEESKHQLINELLSFLSFGAIDKRLFAQKFLPLFDPHANRWASPEVYRLIPKIDELEDAVGSNETGWLFK